MTEPKTRRTRNGARLPADQANRALSIRTADIAQLGTAATGASGG